MERELLLHELLDRAYGLKHQLILLKEHPLVEDDDDYILPIDNFDKGKVQSYVNEIETKLEELYQYLGDVSLKS